MGKRCTSTVSLQEAQVNEDDTNDDYVDGNLIERDVTLIEDGIHMSNDYAIEEKEFKLHHPIYMVKSGVEVNHSLTFIFRRQLLKMTLLNASRRPNCGCGTFWVVTKITISISRIIFN